MARFIRSYVVLGATACSTVAAVSIPDYQTIAPTQNTLNVSTASLTVPNSPFGIVYAKKDIGFAAIEGGKVGILNTTTFMPILIGEISLPEPFYQPAYSVNGLAISRDKQTVYVAVGTGAVAIDVAKAVAGKGNSSIVGLLGENGVGTGAIGVTLSLDDSYVFVNQEYGSKATGLRGGIEVFNVSRAQNGCVSGKYIGFAVLNYAVAGATLSSDGSKLYATSETATSNSTQGTLSILDVATLKTNPSEALLGSVDAGCQPVRVAVSHNGEQVWVTARASNKLLAFDAGKLESNASDALLASVQVGTSPVGVTFVNRGRHIITADSNRFGTPNATTGLTVVDVGAALKGKQGFPRIATGLFPREFAVSLDGKTLLVSDYDSDAIQAVNVSQLAWD